MLKIKSYFDDQLSKPEFVGIWPMGTGSLVEIPYRHYWELRHLLKILPKNQNLKILELGCGAGRWAFSLTKIVSKYVGVDLSERQINYARQKSKKDCLSNCTFIEADITKPILLNGQEFDVIYFGGVLQYLNDDQIQTLLLQCKPWLTKSGVIIDRSTIVTKRERYVRDDENYFCIYRTPMEYEKIFEMSGFCQTYNARTYRYLRFPYFWNLKPISELTKRGFGIASWLTFRMMLLVSIIGDLLCGNAGREGDGIFYSHNYFVFRKQTV